LIHNKFTRACQRKEERPPEQVETFLTVSAWTKGVKTNYFFLAIKPFASATASMADLPYPSAPILSAHS